MEMSGFREMYPDLLYPADIGSWLQYKPYSNQELLAIQKENLIDACIENGMGDIRFIYTKEMRDIEEYLLHIQDKVRLEDTEVVLENEIFYTMKIEGAKTTKARTHEIHNGSKIDFKNAFSETMVRNGFRAVRLMETFGNYLTEEQLLEVWDTLVLDYAQNYGGYILSRCIRRVD